MYVFQKKVKPLVNLDVSQTEDILKIDLQLLHSIPDYAKKVRPPVAWQQRLLSTDKNQPLDTTLHYCRILIDTQRCFLLN